MKAWMAILVWLLAVQAQAQEYEAETYGPVLTACYARADTVEAKKACSGLAFDACTNTEDGGHTTLGMSLCAAGEAQVWDRLLNAEYAATKAAYAEMDADEKVHFPEFANRVLALRDAQRAWIAFLDAECALAYAQWGSGSMRHIAGTTCLSDMTAQRTIALYEMRLDY